MRTKLACAVLSLAVPAAAHLNIQFSVVGPAGTQYTVTTQDNVETKTGAIPASGRVDSTIVGYVNHDGSESLSASFDDGLGSVACAPQVIGIYEPAWHYKATCVPTFTYDGGTRTCATTCPDRPVTPPSPGALPRAFPNPLRVGLGGDAVKFKNFSAGATVRIYNASGRLVYQSTAGAEGDLHWHLQDLGGQPAGTGVYRAVADTRGGLQSVLFAIQR
jgi:hypothetical protein